MRQHVSHPTAVVGATVVAVLLLAGCGSAPDTSAKPSKSTSSPTPSSASAAADTSLGRGTWLLGLSSAGGADAEKATTTYVSFDPSTGVAHARKMPGVNTPSADPDDAPLLVSADRKWAIPDTSITRDEGRSGRLMLYSVTSGATKVIDMRARTGDSSITSLAWAFDPRAPETLRVVDSKNRVWLLAVGGKGASRAGALPRGPWVFADGFNHNTGQPYVESITSDQTRPAGNGVSDTSAVARNGGTVLASGSAVLAKLPQSPCRLGAAFTDGQGTSWTFCADGPAIKTYYLSKNGDHWTAYGKPSGHVAPIAAGFPLVLPPQR
jgi:hypothetical protein